MSILKANGKWVKKLGGTGIGSAGGTSFNWNLTVYGKGLQHQIFLDNRPFTFERFPVFKFWLCPGLLVPWE